MSKSDYPDNYIETCFLLYYENGCKISTTLINAIPECDTNEDRKPGKTQLERWEKNYGWQERADALAVEESNRMQDVVISRRVEMFKKHEEVGTELMEKGMKYLEENGINNDNAAIRAIDLGISTRTASVGVAENLVKISKMTDQELTASIMKLLGTQKPDSVDAELIEDK